LRRIFFFFHFHLWRAFVFLKRLVSFVLVPKKTTFSGKKTGQIGFEYY